MEAKLIDESSPMMDIWIRKSIQSERGKKGTIAIVKKFLAANSLDPEQLLTEWKKVRFDYAKREQFLIELNETIESYFYRDLENYSPGSKHTQVYRIIGFFKANHIAVEPQIKENVYVKYHNKDITSDDIKRILPHASLKYRAFFLTMAESGQRPYTLVQLRYKHIKEDYETQKIPMCINIPAELLKGKPGDRFSFLGEDAFNVLKQYLDSRGKLEDNDWVFAADVTKEGYSPDRHLTPMTFSREFNRIVRELKMVDPEPGKPAELRLYNLRKYFRNNLKMEFRNKDWLMGHKKGTDDHYISEDKEYYRELYRQGYPSLRVYAPEESVTSEKVAELVEQIKKKDTDLSELKERVDLLTQIVARTVNKEDLGSLDEAWTAFMTDILSQMKGKMPKGYKVVKVEEEEKEGE